MQCHYYWNVISYANGLAFGLPSQHLCWVWLKCAVNESVSQMERLNRHERVEWGHQGCWRGWYFKERAQGLKCPGGSAGEVLFFFLIRNCWCKKEELESGSGKRCQWKSERAEKPQKLVKLCCVLLNPCVCVTESIYWLQSTSITHNETNH